ncbi:hypothetical protein BDN71DRAFT_1430352 [Pleurotus eryngii]|uniref:Uncharacterized protein n=1 Tax=Pleurotus eryngii TaxID=5323 RepID=A0A9P6DG52_PLEER|nr:hypothetical protein BDN71DRAFT_1430352 [Pleurotus eryngii]
MVIEDASDGDDEEIYWGGDDKDNKEEKERNENGDGDGDADDKDNDEGGEGDNDNDEEDNPDHSPDGFWSWAPTDNLPCLQSHSHSPNQEPQPDGPSEQMRQRRRRCKRANNIVHDAADVAQLKVEVHELCDVDLLNIKKLGMIKVADPRDVQAYGNEPQGPYQPSIEDFRPNLGCSIFSLWNKRLGELFAEKFVSSVEYSCKDKAAVTFTFEHHLYHVQDKHNDLTVPWTEANKMQKSEKKVVKSQENRQHSVNSCTFEWNLVMFLSGRGLFLNYPKFFTTRLPSQP